MSMSAEVLNGRISRAIDVVESALKGLPEGEGGVSTFQVVTVLTDVEEALLGMSDAPDTSKSGAIDTHQGAPITEATRPQPDAETVAPSTPAPDAESTMAQGEEKRPADKLHGRHGSKTLAEMARQKTQKFHAAREKAAKEQAAKLARKASKTKGDAGQTTAERIRAAQRSTGL
jgi:hypothetical protein